MTERRSDEQVRILVGVDGSADPEADATVGRAARDRTEAAIERVVTQAHPAALVESASGACV
jgi:hypothetical protein